jgi:hypothetical protein
MWILPLIFACLWWMLRTKSGRIVLLVLILMWVTGQLKVAPCTTAGDHGRPECHDVP